MQLSKVGFLDKSTMSLKVPHYASKDGDFLICAKFVEKFLGKEPNEIEITISDEKLTGNNVLELEIEWEIISDYHRLPAWRIFGSQGDFNGDLSAYARGVLTGFLGDKEEVRIWLRLTSLE